MRQADV